jgi:hypothetical protein
VWQPREVGEVIAERRLVLRRAGQRPKGVRVRFGKPVKAPRTPRDPWWCPVQVSGLGPTELHAIAGEDSLQALVLALKYVTQNLPTHARRLRGRIDWLGEEERLVFADTFMLEAQEAALRNLRGGLRVALTALAADSLSPSRRKALQSKLEGLVESWGFEGHPAFKGKRRGRIAS